LRRTGVKRKANTPCVSSRAQRGISSRIGELFRQKDRCDLDHRVNSSLFSDLHTGTSLANPSFRCVMNAARKGKEVRDEIEREVESDSGRRSLRIDPLRRHGSRHRSPHADTAARRETLRGEVRFDAGSRALYSTDSSNYRQVPIGVVIPRDRDDVLETLALCRRFGAPILGRGAGTSLAGQCCNVAVVLDTSKYFHRILEVDPASKTARVEPGPALDDMADGAGKQGRTSAPAPARHASCRLGAMIGHTACA